MNYINNITIKQLYKLLQNYIGFIELYMIYRQNNINYRQNYIGVIYGSIINYIIFIDRTISTIDRTIMDL